MADAKERERRNPIGPTARTVGINVKRVRSEQQLTQAQLSDRLAENGHPIPVSSIGRIETSDRRVEVDDLMALSVALGVSPLALLMPAPRDPRDNVELTGWGSESAVDAWRWATTGRPFSRIEGSVDLSFPWWFRVDARFVLEDVHPVARERELDRRAALENDDGVG